MRKNITHFIAEIIKLFVIAWSLFNILQIVILKSLFFLLPESVTINKKILNMPDLRFSLLSIFAFLFIGWAISFVQKRVSIINPLKLKVDELGSLIVSSILFSYFFTQSFSILKSVEKGSLIFLSVCFLLFFTQIVEFFKDYKFEDLKKVKSYFKQVFSLSNLKFLVKNLNIVLIVVLILYSAFITFVALNNSDDYKRIVKDDLFITKITPRKTTLAYNVAVEGYNFGGIPDTRYKLRSTQGQVITKLWTDNKIEFVTPLHWSVGNIDLWIERPNKYDESKTITSNAVTLEILNRWDFFPTKDDDKYVRGIKKVFKYLYLDHLSYLGLF